MPNLNVLTHGNEGNKGATVSMNLGIRQSNSKYIAFIDADDIWYPEKLSKQVAILDNMPDVDLVYTNGNVIDMQDNVLYKIYRDHEEKNIIGDILINCYIRTPSAVIVRRKILDSVGLFNQKYFYSKDHDMWIKLSEVTKFFYCSETLMAYRMHAGQQSGKRNQWDEGFGVLKDAVMRYPYGKKIISKRLAVLHYRLAQHEKSDRKYLSYLVHMFSSFLNDPKRALGVFFASQT